MTPGEAGGKVWRIMDTESESWWRRKKWLYRIEVEVGETHEVQCHFYQIGGPFVDRNPKGGKKRSNRGKAPPLPPRLAMTLIESKTTVFRASRVSERRSLELLAGTGMKDEFGLKEGAECGERGEWEEIEQHIESRKTTDARFLEISIVLGWRCTQF